MTGGFGSSCAADKAWPLVLNDLDWFIEHGDGKKMYFDEVRIRAY